MMWNVALFFVSLNGGRLLHVHSLSRTLEVKWSAYETFAAWFPTVTVCYFRVCRR